MQFNKEKYEQKFKELLKTNLIKTSKQHFSSKKQKVAIL